MAASDNIIYVDTSTTAITLTLPVPTNGRVLSIKDKTGNAGTHNITVAQHATDTIDGAASYLISTNYGSVDLQSDGTNWFTKRPTQSIDNFFVKNLTGLGGATSTVAIVNIGATNPLTTTNQNGVNSSFTSSSAATASIRGFNSSLVQAAGITTNFVTGLNVGAITKGSGSTITNAVSAILVDQTGNGSNTAILADTNSFTGGDFAINIASTKPSVLSGLLNMNGGLSMKTRTVTTTATVGANDSVILCNQSAAFALTLPAATDGRFLIIKDFSGTAGTNAITVTRAGSDLIDGATTYVMNNNFASITLVGSSGNWSVC